MKTDILQRYIEGNSTQEEKEAIAKWLDADEKNMQEFMLFRGVYDASLWHSEDLSTEENFSISQPQSKKYRTLRSKIVTEIFKVAAIFLIVLGFYHFFLSSGSQISNSNSAYQTVYAPEGERAEIILADGTKVWLNAKSSLKFPSHFSEKERLVELDGEAYFDVTHDDSKKFIVQTETYQVKVHGTEFNVNAYHNSDYFETSLIKGSVEVVSKLTKESILLKPNEKVCGIDNKLVLSNIEIQDQFLWTKGILYFENQKIEDLFKKLELYYDVQIETKNKAILSHRYTGKFWINDGVEHVLRVLQFRHHFKYTRDNTNKIIIY